MGAHQTTVATEQMTDENLQTGGVPRMHFHPGTVLGYGPSLTHHPIIIIQKCTSLSPWKK